MRVIFMGTPDFAVPCLDALIENKHDVCAVFTNPDKPKGRGYELSETPIKKEAKKFNIKIFQPNNLKDPKVLDILKNLKPDIIIVVAYGKILTKEILELPPKGCINVHGSLLPKYRGAAPIQWSVINGDKKTGITTMYMNEGLDTGDIILKKETEIGKNETTGELFDRLCLIGAKLLIETLDLDKINSIKQNDKEATYAKMIDRSISKINWSKTSEEIHNLVRGLNPWPSAYFEFKNKILKVHKTKIPINKDFNNRKEKKQGEILSLNPVVISCGNDTKLELIEVQYEGKKRMKAEDFFRGQRVEVGDYV